MSVLFICDYCGKSSTCSYYDRFGGWDSYDLHTFEVKLGKHYETITLCKEGTCLYSYTEIRNLVKNWVTGVYEKDI